MMKRLYTRLILMLWMLILPAGVASCSDDDPMQKTEQPVPPVDKDHNDTPNLPNDNEEDNSSGINGGNSNSGNDDNNNNTSMSNNLKITIGSVAFNVTLDDNAATAAFKALLPMTVNMSEMNGNEKYYYLSGSLPTASVNPGTIQVGDLMLYGRSCLVLFYETFRTSYSYTRLGRVDNPSGLATALGSGNVTVTFELQ